MYTNTHTYNLPNVCTFAHMYECLGLTTWDYITYQGLVPGEN